MNKKFVLSCIAAGCVLLCGCNVLPEEDAASSSSATSQSTVVSTTSDSNTTTTENTEFTKADAKKYVLNAEITALMKLPPMLSEEEKTKLDAEKALVTPYTEADEDLVDYCRIKTTEAVNEFLEDYPSEDYTNNKDNRVLSMLYDGQTTAEINGGLNTVKIGSTAGYWRFADCSYYNMIFFADEENEKNIVKSLFRCNAYYYSLNDASNLVNGAIGEEVTTDNSTITEYKDVFIVVSQNDVTPQEVSKDENGGFINDKCLMFKSYDEAVNSFRSPAHTFEDLYIGEEYSMTIMDGYKGRPIVTMPDLTGKYIDVSLPENVRELDELNITNYKVEWVDNDGSLVPYSIQSSSIAPGTSIDITDTSKDSQIVVTVASPVGQTSN